MQTGIHICPQTAIICAVVGHIFVHPDGADTSLVKSHLVRTACVDEFGLQIQVICRDEITNTFSQHHGSGIITIRMDIKAAIAISIPSNHIHIDHPDVILVRVVSDKSTAAGQTVFLPGEPHQLDRAVELVLAQQAGCLQQRSRTGAVIVSPRREVLTQGYRIEMCGQQHHLIGVIESGYRYDQILGFYVINIVLVFADIGIRVPTACLF